jgi:hypothetical protein
MKNDFDSIKNSKENPLDMFSFPEGEREAIEHALEELFNSSNKSTFFVCCANKLAELHYRYLFKFYQEVLDDYAIKGIQLAMKLQFEEIVKYKFNECLSERNRQLELSELNKKQEKQ